MKNLTTMWWCRTAGAAVVMAMATVAVQAQQRVVQLAYPTGSPSTSVILMERTMPAQIRLGETLEYSVKLTNLTQAKVSDLVWTEKLPERFTPSGIEPRPDTDGGGTASWNLGSLGPKASKTVRVRGTLQGRGEFSACGTVTFRTGICSTVTVVEPQLTLEKKMPPEVLVCDPIPVDFVVSNPGDGMARNVRVVDRLPEGLRTRDGKTEFAANVGDLGPGQSRRFRVELKADRPGSFVNQATAEEQGGLTASADASIRVTECNLVVEKSGPGLRYIGRPAEFVLTVRNAGDAPARDVTLVDMPPSGVRVSNIGDGGQAQGNRIAWQLGTLEPGQTRTVRLAMTAQQAGMFENRAAARGYCCEGEAMETLEVRGVPAILLEVIDIDDPVEIGSNETYEIRVTNQGTANDTNIVIAVELPPQQSFVSANGPAGVQTQGQRIVFNPVPVLGPRQVATFRVVGKANTEGDVRFRVAMNSDQLQSPVEETESTHIY